MTAAAKQIFEAALKLEPSERERLAEALWQSIEHQGDVEAAWAEEVKERIAAADAGEIDSTPWDEARDEPAHAAGPRRWHPACHRRAARSRLKHRARSCAAG